MRVIGIKISVHKINRLLLNESKQNQNVRCHGNYLLGEENINNVITTDE